jgi:chitinase
MREYNLAVDNAYLRGKLEALESCPCPNQGGVPLQQMNPQQVYCQQGGQYVPYQQGQMINAGQEVFYNQGGNWQRKVAIANTVFNGIGTIVGLGLQAWQIWGGSRGWYAPQNTFNVFNNTTTTLPPVTTIGGRGYDFGGLGGVTLGSGTDFGGIR